MIPEGWLKTTLARVVLGSDGLQTGPFGSQLHASDYTLHGIPVVMPKDLARGRITTATVARVPDTIAADLHRHRVQSGDLLFGRRGDIGRCGLVFADESGWLCGTGCLRARPDLGHVHPAFLLQAVCWSPTIQWLNENAVGQTMLNLSVGILERLPLCLPPLPEQRKIAAILSSVDAAIEATEAVIQQLQIVKKAMMAELLTRGIPGRHTKFKMTEIGEVPEEWEVVPLGDLSLFVTSGSRGWAQFYAEEGALFVRITNLTRGTTRLDLSERQHVRLPAGSAEGTRTRVESGDVLVSITADLGIVGLVPPGFEEAYVNQHIALVRLDQHRADPRYVASALAGEIGQVQVRRLNDGGAKAGLSLPSIRQLLIPLPSLREQATLAEPIDRTEQRIQAESTSLTALREVKAALMSVLLTGEVRVKPDEAAA
jgi:type I restriction enzyme S subunit